MARGGRRAQGYRGPIAKFEHGLRLADQQSALDIITPEQRAKGTYTDGQRIMNHGATPVMRWASIGRMTDTQLLAISLCNRLWDMVGHSQKMTSSYGERLPPSDYVDENRRLAEIQAKQDLERIEGYFAGLSVYWDMFVNVCRFNEPAGVAGSRLGFGDRSAQERAHTVVCQVADTIAAREGLVPVFRILTA